MIKPKKLYLYKLISNPIQYFHDIELKISLTYYFIFHDPGRGPCQPESRYAPAH